MTKQWSQWKIKQLTENFVDRQVLKMLGAVSGCYGVTRSCKIGAKLLQTWFNN